ncbi:3-hydroxybutyryl-CoA dehydrogenase [Dyadobacter jejuensis]|uniref:3-hydroxybutyryl-CoA dehydrogenase n=1 Tax=Dyadobacter jejuensis TaxID=1082580 RepID=A0A316AK25_9BACT|nr:3-hydroxyacyl-CoA dehydrogenase family protein [Dyadobacter jejuensis]PWJ58165.1 3-hydroxybutyryl-CoA dehydrogenase [Dyadobacter jejuensis]
MIESAKVTAASTPMGVVGLGLMGSSIVAALLIAGHPVQAIVPIPSDFDEARHRVARQLRLCEQAGLIDSVADFDERLQITEDYQTLAGCQVVIECVIEKLEVKKEVYQKITSVVTSDCIIGTNTSAIPISELQQYIMGPERFVGIHFAEPAYMTRFLEITCGRLTTDHYAQRIFSLAQGMGKEPTLLKKDIRGFITNRLMYAVYREIFHQLETGHATREDLDKAFRYDAGSWMTLMGIFRRMDYLGIEDFGKILPEVFSKLSNTHSVPQEMKEMVEKNARGIHNETGLYPYQKGEGKQWDLSFSQFNLEIHRLAAEFSEVKIKEQLSQ